MYDSTKIIAEGILFFQRLNHKFKRMVALLIDVIAGSLLLFGFFKVIQWISASISTVDIIWTIVGIILLALLFILLALIFFEFHRTVRFFLKL